MSRSLLFFIIFGTVLIAGLAAYWLSTKETNREAAGITAEESDSTVKDTPLSEPTSDSPLRDTFSDEDAPKPTSVNLQKFESEDDATDTEDSVTIEVEPEEE